MSGLIHCDNHWREPMSCCIRCLNLSLSMEDMVEDEMLSMGRPERYGDLGSVVLSLSNPASDTKLSMNAVCNRCVCKEVASHVQSNFFPRK